MRFVPKRLVKTQDNSRGDTSWQSYLKNSLSVVITMVALYLVLGAVSDLVAYTLPERWEIRLFSWSRFESAPLRDDALVRETFDQLVQHAELRPLRYELFLLPTPDPNAFAFPGGKVAVTQGLLDLVESQAGLATVLSHELGHHQHRHSLKRLGRGLIFTLAHAVLFGGSDSSVLDASLRIAESSYSRRQERQADEFGMRLVHEVFGNTEQSLEFFEDMREGEERRWSAFLRSHPLTSERITDLRQLQQSLLDD